jgi:hypothetical protein
MHLPPASHGPTRVCSDPQRTLQQEAFLRAYSHVVEAASHRDEGALDVVVDLRVRYARVAEHPSDNVDIAINETSETRVPFVAVHRSWNRRCLLRGVRNVKILFLGTQFPLPEELIMTTCRHEHRNTGNFSLLPGISKARRLPGCGACSFCSIWLKTMGNTEGAQRRNRG